MNFTQVTDMLGLSSSRKEGTENADKASTAPEFDPTKLGEKQTYFEWEALSRPTQKGLNKKMLKTFTMIGIVMALVLVVLQEYFLILLIASMIFISHVLSKTPPTLVKYELSTHGVSIDGEVYYWPEIRRFFFTDNDGHASLVMDMLNNVPSRLFLTIHEKDRTKLKDIFNDHTHYLEVAPESFLDKTFSAVSDKLQK